MALSEDGKIAVVGLGYVGLPVALGFAKHFEDVLGYDINRTRVESLSKGKDPSGEVPGAELQTSKIRFSADPQSLRGRSLFIVAVPTPVDQDNRPDFTALLGATRTVAQHLSPGSVVVYESTVYPGVTEDVCVPALEEVSGLVWKKDFFVGYSPERINPGDRERTLEKIVKVVAGDTPETTKRLEAAYGKVVTAGLHLASSIKVAEAAKVIENTQRDLNIALMNELALIFDRMGIRTKEVLDAAATKWNFLRFNPGLVGGHCIGVDPYYLTTKAEQLGYHPQVILAGRRINDSMGTYMASGR